jgi:hypothetical protein
MVLSIASCKETQDDTGYKDAIPQELTIDTTFFTLQGALVKSYGTNNLGVANFDIGLYTEGIELVLNDQGLPINTLGSGRYLYLEAWSQDSLRIANGAYAMDTSASEVAKTISSGELFEINNNTITAVHKLTSGIFETAVKESEITIIGRFETASGKKGMVSFKQGFDYYEL